MKDDAIWNSILRRWALRSSVDPTGQEIIALMGYMQLCPPHVMSSQCRVWYDHLEVGQEERIIMRHGMAITMTVQRDIPQEAIATSLPPI